MIKATDIIELGFIQIETERPYDIFVRKNIQIRMKHGSKGDFRVFDMSKDKTKSYIHQFGYVLFRGKIQTTEDVNTVLRLVGHG